MPINTMAVSYTHLKAIYFNYKQALIVLLIKNNKIQRSTILYKTSLFDALGLATVGLGANACLLYTSEPYDRITFVPGSSLVKWWLW